MAAEPPDDPDLGSGLDDVQFELKKRGLGGEILLLFGIDFTASNQFQGLVSFDDRPLHDLSPAGRPNPYLRTIQIVGGCLEPFTSRVLGFGFGDVTTQDQAVFPLHAGDGCDDWRQLVQCYRRVTPRVRMGSRTGWSSLIQTAVELTQAAGQERGRSQFGVLVIVGDGTSEHQRQAVEDIVQAASAAPLAVLFVGVGDGFSPELGGSDCLALERLDQDIGKLERPFNNFSFCSFTRIEGLAGPGGFAATLGLNLLHGLPESMAVALSLEDIKVLDPAAGLGSPVTPSRRRWRCPVCTYSNAQSAAQCAMCGADRPASEQAPEEEEFKVEYESQPEELERDQDQRARLEAQIAQLEAERDRLSRQIPDRPDEWGTVDPSEMARAVQMSEQSQQVPGQRGDWGTVDPSEMARAVELSEQDWRSERASREREAQLEERAIRLSEQEAQPQWARTEEELEAIRLSEQEYKNAQMEKRNAQMLEDQAFEAVRLLSQNAAASTQPAPAGIVPKLSLGSFLSTEQQPAPLSRREKFDVMAQTVCRPGRRTLTTTSESFQEAKSMLTPREPPKPQQSGSVEPSAPPDMLSELRATLSLRNSRRHESLGATLGQPVGAALGSDGLSGGVGGQFGDSQAGPSSPEPAAAQEPATGEQGNFDRWLAEAGKGLSKGKGKGKGGKGKGGKGPPKRGKGGEILDKGRGKGVQRNPTIMAMYKDVFKKGGSGSKARQPQQGNNSKVPAALSGDLLSELKNQSAFFKKVQQQADEMGPDLAALSPIIQKYSAPSPADVLEFVSELEKTLGALEDEVQVLKLCAPDWPFGKVGVLRELAKRYANMQRMTGLVERYATIEAEPGTDLFGLTEQLVAVFDSVTKELDGYGRRKEADEQRFVSMGLDFSWPLLQKIKEATIGLAGRYCQLALAQWQEFSQSPEAEGAQASVSRRHKMLRRRTSNLMQGALGFGFRVYGYAGGFDDTTTELYGQVHASYQEMQGAEGSPAEAQTN